MAALDIELRASARWRRKDCQATDPHHVRRAANGNLTLYKALRDVGTISGKFSILVRGLRRRLPEAKTLCWPLKHGSAIGTLRTWGHARRQSVMRTKADVCRPLQVYGFTPRAGPMMEIGLRQDGELKTRRAAAALIKPLHVGMTIQKGDNALSGTRDRDGPDRHQWPAFDVGACHGVVTAGAAGGAGRKERDGFPARAGAGVGSRQIPVHRADRDHAGRRAVGRVFRRHAGSAFDQPAGRGRIVARHGRCDRRRHRRHRDHLRLADHRRTGAEADRAARSGSGGGQGRAGHDAAGEDLVAAGVVARSLGQGAAVAARPARRGRGARSAKTKSALWWWKPRMPACSSPARRR